MRLALEFTLVAGLIHGALAFVLVAARSQYFATRFDDDLQDKARVIAATVSALPEDDPVGLGQTVNAIASARDIAAPIVEVVDGRGTVLAGSAPGVHLPPPLPAGSPPLLTIDGESVGRPGDTLRLASAPAMLGSRRVYVEVAESLAPVAQATATLRTTLFLLVLPGTMLGTGIAAWFLSGRVLRRLDSVAEAMRKVSLGGASTRVEVEGGRDEIGEMVSEMNAMLARLESAFRAQERFIVNVTHELKTPVSIMLAQAQLLKASRGVVPKEHHEFVVSVEEEMRRLGALLESFLTLARAGQGQRAIESNLVSLPEVVVESIRRASPGAADKGVSLVPIFGEDLEEEPALRGDGELLTTALANMIRDAVEQAPPGSPVEVAIESQSGQTRIAVRHRPDRDAGGSARSYARPSRRRTRELAMEVARGIAQLHGGDVWTEEAEGICRSVIRLPMAEVEAARE